MNPLCDRQAWFRYRSPLNHTDPIRTSLCDGPPPLETYGGGVYLPEHRMVLPCPHPTRFLIERHDACLSSAGWAFRTPPPNQTTWLRGVTAMGNEGHADNFNHFNRDSAGLLTKRWQIDLRRPQRAPSAGPKGTPTGGLKER